MSNEAVLAVPTPEIEPNARPVTAGNLLRAAREREGLHIAALAVSMKVPVKKLEALEADRLDLLPDAVFVRALASSVCRTLKSDPAPILRLLPASAPPRLHVDDRGINTPFDSPGQASNVSALSFLTKPPALMVVLLMIAAVGVYFYPEASRELSIGETLHAVTSQTAAEVPNFPQDAPVAVGKSLLQPEPVAADAPTALAPSTSVVPPAAITPPTLMATPVMSAAKPVPVVGTPTLGDVLVLKAKGLAWVQVTDAKGVQLLSRTLQPAETVGIDGALPLSVVVGRVDLTTVELRGKPFDLSNIAQNNVARFEVRP